MRRFLAAAVSVLAALILFPSIAFADDAAVNPNDTVASIRLSVAVVSVIVGTVLPLLVGLVTNYLDSALLKGALLLVLNAIADFILQATMVDGSAVFSKATVILFVVSTASGVVAFITAWRPARLTSGRLGPVVMADGSLVQPVGRLSQIGPRSIDVGAVVAR